MLVREFYQKALQFIQALSQGDWIAAAGLILELSPEFLPQNENTPRPMMGAVAGEGDDLTDEEAADLKAKIKEAKAALKAPPRGAKATVGGPWAILLVQLVGPALLKKFEEWLRNRKTA
jgi:hypothetical protein